MIIRRGKNIVLKINFFIFASIIFPYWTSAQSSYFDYEQVVLQKFDKIPDPAEIIKWAGVFDKDKMVYPISSQFKINCLLSEYYRKQKDYERSYKYAIQSLTAAQKLPNNVAIGTSYILLAKVLGPLKKTEVLNARIPELVDYFQKVDDHLAEFETIHVWARIEIEQDIKHGMSLYKQCLSLAKKSGSEFKANYIKNDISAVYLLMNLTDSALIYFNKNEYDSTNRSRIIYHSNLGYYHLIKENYSKSLVYYDSAFALAKDQKFNQCIVGIYHDRYLAYKSLGNSKLALEQHEKYQSTKDALESKKNQTTILQFDYDQLVLSKKNEAYLKDKQIFKAKVSLNKSQNLQTLLLGIVILIILGFILFYNRISNRRKRLKIQLEIEVLKSKLQKEKIEQEKLRNEKIQNELDLKSVNIQNFSIELEHRLDFSNLMIQELNEIKSNFSNHELEQQLNDIISTLKAHGKNDSDYTTLTQQIKLINNEFRISLIKKFPNLSKGDVDLCCYIRIQLSNKEIAAIKKVSVKSVEVGRYRLRKKLSLFNKENLFSYLSQL